MAQETRKEGSQRPSIDELRRSLSDNALRDEIRRRYEADDEMMSDAENSDGLEDQPSRRKEAIFNSW